MFPLVKSYFVHGPPAPTELLILNCFFSLFRQYYVLCLANVDADLKCKHVEYTLKIEKICFSPKVEPFERNLGQKN